MLIRLRLAVLVAGMMLTGWAEAQSTPKAALLALSKQNHTLAIVDPKTLQVVTRIPVGDDPHEVVASADGKTAYVSNYGFGAFPYIGGDRFSGAEADAIYRSGCAARPAWFGIRAGQGLVYGGSRQGDRQL
jgi:YVTN family beta-propeller protein